MLIIIILIILIFWLRILTGLVILGSLTKHGVKTIGEAIENNIERERKLTLKQRIRRSLIFFFIAVLAFVYLT